MLAHLHGRALRTAGQVCTAMCLVPQGAEYEMGHEEAIGSLCRATLHLTEHQRRGP